MASLYSPSVGFSAALLAQVPYQLVMMSSFEALDSWITTSGAESITFNKNDEVPFIVKFGYRFGACTLSLLLAQTLLYPFDTVKRCLQLNGSRGHKLLYDGSLTGCFKTLMAQGGIKTLYQGFGVNLLKTGP
mmetsp:Transcript_15060/g.23304  ORF Transcript_15060/g.23304 Transcript_15060/m.23304 type:complete len:132 (+) Transcript_15060:263-658(+)